MRNEDTGLLLNDKNIKLHRSYFQQMVKLLGLNVLYRAPIPDAKQYNMYGELDAHFYQPEMVGCIYDEHPSQKTMQKLGWNAEMADSSVIIHVPYDLKGLQAGALFIIPSGLDNTEGRVFKVLRMGSIALYPASISCELGPVMINQDDPATVHDFEHSNFNMLDGESDEYGH